MEISKDTKKKPRPKTKEVSSRYLSTPSTIARSPSPFLTSPRPDRFPDENAPPTNPSETLARRKKLFSETPTAQTPHPFRSKDDIAFSATRSFDWGRERREGCDTPRTTLLRSSSGRSDGQRHSYDASKDGGRGFAAAIKAARPPTCAKMVVGPEVRRERKGTRREEEVHSLRMLECRYLQLRFANAKAQAVNCSRRATAEKSLYSVSCKLVELRESVIAKRIEVELLRRATNVSTIIESQMPYLDEWTSLEGEHSTSLSGTTEALHNASSQIPITGNVKADVGQLKEVTDTAVDMLDSVTSCIDKFLIKAEGVDEVSSELAKLVSIQKTMIEECGNLLSVAHDLQMTECSLRGQLMQVKQRNDK